MRRLLSSSLETPPGHSRNFCGAELSDPSISTTLLTHCRGLNQVLGGGGG